MIVLCRQPLSGGARAEHASKRIDHRHVLDRKDIGRGKNLGTPRRSDKDPRENWTLGNLLLYCVAVLHFALLYMVAQCCQSPTVYFFFTVSATIEFTVVPNCCTVHYIQYFSLNFFTCAIYCLSKAKYRGCLPMPTPLPRIGLWCESAWCCDPHQLHKNHEKAIDWVRGQTWCWKSWGKNQL